MKKIITASLLLILFSCQRKMNSQTDGRHPEVKQELRILSYNIHHANPPSKAGFIDIDAIARVINNAKADLVALQEVDKNTARSGHIDEAKLIAEKTGLQYHFFKAIDYDGGDYGIAILSRFEIRDPVLLPLPQQIKAENRVLSHVMVTVNKQEIILANTHLDATKGQENRILQMQAILKSFEAEKRPVILCGDLNSVAGSAPINLLDQQFTRTCITDCPGTVPHGNPVRTIDYIATKNLLWPLLSYEVIPETYASDHRPVIAVFKTAVQ
jgi:endonuclease/exonuclease/phosphatase family metal-dependent hydrolase